jgi:uncharacterized protein (TIGR03000 family)
VRLPEGASLFVDNVASPYKGVAYSFDTPPLEPARAYRYTVRAELTRNGQRLFSERKITFRLGDTVTIDFRDLGQVAARRATTNAVVSGAGNIQTEN